MKKTYICIPLLLLVVGLTVSGLHFINEAEQEILYERSKNGMVQCLADSGVVIYGSRTCPACANLIQMLGGTELIAPIYLECSENVDRCNKEKATNYIPEVQIKGAVFEGKRSLDSFAQEVGCNT